MSAGSSNRYICTGGTNHRVSVYILHTVDCTTPVSVVIVCKIIVIVWTAALRGTNSFNEIVIRDGLTAGRVRVATKARPGLVGVQLSMIASLRKRQTDDVYKGMLRSAGVA